MQIGQPSLAVVQAYDIAVIAKVGLNDYATTIIVLFLYLIMPCCFLVQFNTYSL